MTEVFPHTSDHLRILIIRNASGNAKTIRTTDSHPFYGNGLGWSTAGELKIAQRLNETDAAAAGV